MGSAATAREDRRWRVAAWALLAGGIAAFLLGQVLGAFRLVWFDEALHSFNAFAVALVLSTLLGGRLSHEPSEHRALRVFLITCVTIALGVLWEVVEWIYDLARADDVVKGKRDTMLDLLFDSLGGLIGAALGLRAWSPAGGRHGPGGRPGARPGRWAR